MDENMKLIVDFCEKLGNMDKETKDVIFRLIEKLVLNDTVNSKAEKTKSTKSIIAKKDICQNTQQDYIEYKENLQKLIKDIIPLKNMPNVNDVIQHVKRYLNQSYGIVYAEITNKFKETFDRYPNNDYEIFWWMEEEYPQLKGIVCAIVSDLKKNKGDNIVNCKDIDECISLSKQISKIRFPENTRGPSVIIAGFFKSKGKNIDVKAVKRHYKALGYKRKAGLLEMLKKYNQETQEFFINSFNDYINEK